MFSAPQQSSPTPHSGDREATFSTRPLVQAGDIVVTLLEAPHPEVRGKALLFVRRSAELDNPLTWSFPSGEIEERDLPSLAATSTASELEGHLKEGAITAAMRESHEELTLDHSTVAFSYLGCGELAGKRTHYVLGKSESPVTLSPNWEAEEMVWAPAGWMPPADAHPGLFGAQRRYFESLNLPDIIPGTTLHGHHGTEYYFDEFVVGRAKNGRTHGDGVYIGLAECTAVGFSGRYTSSSPRGSYQLEVAVATDPTPGGYINGDRPVARELLQRLAARNLIASDTLRKEIESAIANPPKGNHLVSMLKHAGLAPERTLLAAGCRGFYAPGYCYVAYDPRDVEIVSRKILRQPADPLKVMEVAEREYRERARGAQWARALPHVLKACHQVDNRIPGHVDQITAPRATFKRIEKVIRNAVHEKLREQKSEAIADPKEFERAHARFITRIADLVTNNPLRTADRESVDTTQFKRLTEHITSHHEKMESLSGFLKSMAELYGDKQTIYHFARSIRTDELLSVACDYDTGHPPSNLPECYQALLARLLDDLKSGYESFARYSYPQNRVRAQEEKLQSIDRLLNERDRWTAPSLAALSLCTLNEEQESSGRQWRFCGESRRHHFRSVASYGLSLDLLTRATSDQIERIANIPDPSPGERICTSVPGVRWVGEILKRRREAPLYEVYTPDELRNASSFGHEIGRQALSEERTKVERDLTRAQQFEARVDRANRGLAQILNDLPDFLEGCKDIVHRSQIYSFSSEATGLRQIRVGGINLNLDQVGAVLSRGIAFDPKMYLDAQEAIAAAREWSRADNARRFEMSLPFAGLGSREHALEVWGGEPIDQAIKNFSEMREGRGDTRHAP